VSTPTQRPAPHARPGVWAWLMGTTLGNAFKLVWWSILAIAISVLVEWVGMIWFWGPDHSQQILEQEITYLSGYNRNLITGLYPSDLGAHFIGAAQWLVGVLHLREISAHLADGAMSAVKQLFLYGINSTINVIFIFAVRAAICVSAISGFVLVGLVAFVDGLVVVRAAVSNRQCCITAQNAFSHRFYFCRLVAI
jgi:hypothetical protein